MTGPSAASPPTKEPQDTDDRLWQSAVLRHFQRAMANRPDAKVLDVGPVCQENVIALARQVQTLYLCDLFVRLHHLRQRQRPQELLWRELDYPDQFFDGVILWDLVDRLPDEVVAPAVTSLQRVMKPGGLLMLQAVGERDLSPQVYATVIEPDHHFSRRLQPHLSLPARQRSNRDLLRLLAPLESMDSVTYRHGLREFIFRR